MSGYKDVLERSQGHKKSNDQVILPAVIGHARGIQARRGQALDRQDRKLRLQDCKLSAVERMWRCKNFTRIGELLTAERRLFDRVVTRIAATPAVAVCCSTVSSRSAVRSASRSRRSAMIGSGSTEVS